MNTTTRPAKSTTAQRRQLLDLMEEHTTRTLPRSSTAVTMWRPTRTIGEEREALRNMAHMSADMVAAGIAWHTAAIEAL